MARALRFELIVRGFGAVKSGGVDGDDSGVAKRDEIVRNALAGRLVILALGLDARGNGGRDARGDQNDA